MTTAQFVTLVLAMRRAQHVYNRSRTVANLITVESLETAVDVELPHQPQLRLDPAAAPPEASAHAR